MSEKITVECTNCGKSKQIFPSTFRRNTTKRFYCDRNCKESFTNRGCSYQDREWLYQKYIVEEMEASEIAKACGCCVSNIFRWMRKHSIKTRVQKDEYLTLICDNCGKTFERRRHRAKRKTKSTNKNFCNLKCHGRWRGRTKKYFGTAKARTVSIRCAWCNELLRRHPHRVNRFRNQFCNKNCYGEFNSENKVGENHPLWKGGHATYYGPNWQAQRRKARKRDNYTCQNCGVTEEEYGRKLDVHHIKPFREFSYVRGENDHYKQANKSSNLVLFCSRCHKQAEFGNIPVQLKLL